MLGFVDETFRDGPQSLWATRMSTRSMIGATEWMDQSGYSRVCATSGASFETAVKFLKENPWERLRALRQAMPNTVFDVLIRSRNLMGWARYPDEVIELLFQCLQRQGVEWVKVFDGLNDMQSIASCFRIARRLGLKSCAMLAFSDSPVHTDAHFAGKAREALAIGVDSIAMCDASGILTGARARTLLAALNAEIQGAVPLEFYAHHSMGLAHGSYREAMRAGVRMVTTACAPLANGESLPAVLDIMAIAQEMGIDTGLNVDAIRRTEDYFTWEAYREGHPVHSAFEYDAVAYDRFVGHQIPGGMISNFRKQLSEIGLSDREDEVLEEASRIRIELGCPTMVTPFSQFVGVQAVFNIAQGERYKTVPAELRRYVLGEYGASPGPIDPDVVDRVLGGKAPPPIDHEAVYGARILGAFAAEHGPFRSDEDLLLALFYGPDHIGKLDPATTRFLARPRQLPPLQALLSELARERDVRSIRVEHPTLSFNVDFASTVSER